MVTIVPAVLPTSREDLYEKLKLFSQIPSVTRIQIDVVDGIFATPASWPFTAPAELQYLIDRGEMLPHIEKINYEIDLMCIDAERAVDAWHSLGATRFTFHAESATHLDRLIASVHKRYGTGDGFASWLISFGLAINIQSDLSLIEPHIGDFDYVQLMGIARIGRQGQPFDQRVFEKIKTLHEKYPELILQVDGGVSLENSRRLITLGVSNLVVGSALLKASDPVAEFAKFEALESPYGV